MALIIIIVFHFNNSCELAIKTILLYVYLDIHIFFVQRLSIMLMYEIHLLEVQMEINVHDRHSFFNAT